MLKFLKNHPFAVEAFFTRSLVLTFAVPEVQLQPLIPPCLELDTFDGRWGFFTIAMVQTRSLRPKGFPEWMGSDFFLVGHRLFVRYKSITGKNLRGLYILKSETNSPRMKFFGNVFTHYHYTAIDLQQTMQGNTSTIQSAKAGVEIITESTDIAPLPAGSPFRDWKEARRFAGPLPFTFTYDAKKGSVLIIEGVREDWIPKPVNVVKYRIDALDAMGLKDYMLANAFEVRNIPYYWKKGRTEQWR